MGQHIERWEGLALAISAPILYVAPFYCIPGMTRVSRDEVKAIAFRCCGAAAACTASIAIMQFYPRMPVCPIRHRLGLSVSLGSIIVPVGMLMAVYFQTLFLDMASGSKMIPYATASRHIVIRDLIMAPVSEEIVFRGYICWVLITLDGTFTSRWQPTRPENVQVLRSAGFSSIAASTIAPVCFGGAHLHHMWQKVVLQKQPMKQACIQQLAQFAYTTLFGFIACCLFLYTGSLASPLVLHVGCNWLGIPVVSSTQLHRNTALRVLWVACLLGVCFVVWHMATHPRSLAQQCT